MTRPPWRGGLGKTAQPAALAPKGQLTDLRLGALVEVYSLWERDVLMVAEVVYLIPAGDVPDRAHMSDLFQYNLRATGLKQPVIPVRTSKYVRVIVRKRGMRCFVFPVNPAAYAFYPASTKELP